MSISLAVRRSRDLSASDPSKRSEQKKMIPSRQVTVVGAHSVTRSRMIGLLPMVATYTSAPGPYGLIKLARTHVPRVMMNGRAASRLRFVMKLPAAAHPSTTNPVKKEPCRLAHSTVTDGNTHNRRL